MTGVNGSGIWQKLAVGAMGVLVTIAFLWIGEVSEAQEDAAAAQVKTNATVNVNSENIRNIHHEAKIDRDLLRRIDRNTGGPGDAPDVRPLREVD